MTTPSENDLDPRALRRALGNFATGITVVTACTPDGEKVGMTANSFNSVSLDPPLILWSIDKRAHSLPAFEAASHFAVNILAADQLELSNHFARPQPDKFAGITHQAGLGGAPLLEGCAARFQCARQQLVEGGDHWILIGRVLAFDDFGRAPLLYHQGAYSMVLPHPSAPRKREPLAADAMHGRLLRDNLFYLMLQALNAYQASYAPRQRATGLSTGEARLLLVLADGTRQDPATLQRETAMPTREIEEALASLQHKGLVGPAASGQQLTEAGQAQTEALWEIVHRQQEAVFGAVSAEELETFKRVLKLAMAAH